MDPKCREALRLTLDVANKQQSILKKVIPTLREIGDLLGKGQKPTDEQLSTWSRLHTQVTQEMLELSAAFQVVLQSAGHLNFDA